jgi:hypothetical protein
VTNGFAILSSVTVFRVDTKFLHRCTAVLGVEDWLAERVVTEWYTKLFFIIAKSMRRADWEILFNFNRISAGRVCGSLRDIGSRKIVKTLDGKLFWAIRLISLS